MVLHEQLQKHGTLRLLRKPAEARDPIDPHEAPEHHRAFDQAQRRAAELVDVLDDGQLRRETEAVFDDRQRGHQPHPQEAQQNEMHIRRRALRDDLHDLDARGANRVVHRTADHAA